MPRLFNGNLMDGLAEKVLFDDFWPKEGIANVTVVIEVAEQAPDHMSTTIGNDTFAGNGRTFRFT